MEKYWTLFKKSLKLDLDLKDREDYGILSAIVGSICNILLFSAKLFFGYLSASVALIADGLNNLSDLVSQAVTLASFKISAKPADKNHPYGHARAEYLATTVVSVLIVLMGIELLRAAINNIGSSELPDTNIYTIIVIVIGILVKLWMYIYNKGLSNHLNSDLLMATAKDSRNDVLASSAVLISVLIGIIFKINIDPYIGGIVALFVLKTGVQILLDMVNRLMGKAPEPLMFKGIISMVNAYPEVLSTHDLLIHEYGQSNIYASIHVSMDAQLPFITIHSIIDQIEREVSKEYGVKLLIHVDPERPIMSADEHRIVRLIQNSVHEVNMELSIHDFQFLENKAGEARRVAFDVVVPDSEKTSNEELAGSIEDKIHAQEPGLHLLMDFDRAYQKVKTKKLNKTSP